MSQRRRQNARGSRRLSKAVHLAADNPSLPPNAVAAQAQRPAADSLLWRVVVDGKTPGMPWGSFVTKAGALATVRRLHALAFAARVVESTS